MLRRLIFLAVLSIAMFAAACGGGTADPDVQREPAGDTVYRAGPTSTPPSQAGAPTEPAAPEATSPAAPIDPPAALPDGDPSGGTASGEALFGALDPFQFVSGVQGEPVQGDVDPSLTAALLDEGDLPSGFVSFGDLSLVTPSEFGGIEMATRMFVGEGFLGGDFGSMIISTAIALPPEALAELGDPANLAELTNLSEADLQEALGGADQFGIEFRELRILDASGLGEGGFGMHMEIYFGGLFEALGAPATDNPFADGITIELYMFVRGDRALMLMAMLPSGEAPPVDLRQLAEIMDARAAAS